MAITICYTILTILNLSVLYILCTLTALNWEVLRQLYELRGRRDGPVKPEKLKSLEKVLENAYELDDFDYWLHRHGKED